MPKMVATKRQRYDSRNVEKGHVFTVKDKDVRLLKALGRVTDFTPFTDSVVPSSQQMSPVVDPVKVAVDEPIVKEESKIDVFKFTDHDEVEEKEESVPVQNDEYSRMLRNRAVSLGIRVDGRWSDARVQTEIDKVQAGRYQRMDMRVEE